MPLKKGLKRKGSFVLNREDSIYQTYLQILKEELVPAMGCTEPIAIAYGAAKAREVLGNIPDEIDIKVSGNILKNVKSVIIPNTDGMRGIESAVAAGIVAGAAKKKLEVITGVTDEAKEDIRKYAGAHNINVGTTDGDGIFAINITVYKEREYVKLKIENSHTNITYIEKNGDVLFKNNDGNGHLLESADRGSLNVEGIVDFADTVSIEDIEAIIEPQINYNYAIAEEGIKGLYGAQIGPVILHIYGDDVKSKAKAMAAAGSDARMGGCELPVIIVAGSGNQGIAASVPVIVYAKELNSSHEELLRALTVSNLMTIHQRSKIGKLSAYCGAVSAGCASGTGIAYLEGGRFPEIAHTIVNSLAIISGMICDGAKPSCAGKIAFSVEAGILGYYMYKDGQQFYGGDGIVAKDVESTIYNVGYLGRKGMKETDKEILRIMLSHNSSE